MSRAHTLSLLLAATLAVLGRARGTFLASAGWGRHPTSAALGIRRICPPWSGGTQVNSLRAEGTALLTVTQASYQDSVCGGAVMEPPLLRQSSRRPRRRRVEPQPCWVLGRLLWVPLHSDNAEA